MLCFCGIPFVVCSPHTLAVLRCRRFNQRSTAGSVAAALTALGVSATGVLNFWFRFPDIPDLLTSPAFLGYIAVSLLFGMAVSYYFDTGDEKLIDILCVGLRLVGAGMIFYSLSQLWEVALAAVIVLVAAVTFFLPRVHFAHSAAMQLHDGALASPVVHAADAMPGSQRRTARGCAGQGVESNGALQVSAWQQSPPPLCTPPSGPLAVVHEGERHGHLCASQLVACHTGASAQQVRHDRIPVCRGDEVQAPASPPRATSMASFFRGSFLSAPPASPVGHTPDSSDSPLLATGHVRNGSTNRLIKLHGATYKALERQGYQLNRVDGVLTPPEKGSGAGRASTADSPAQGSVKGPRSASARRRSAGGAPELRPTSSAVTAPP